MSDTDLIRDWLVCGSPDHWNYPKRVCQECVAAKEVRAAFARVEAEMDKKNAALDLLRRVINNQRHLLADKDAALDRSHNVVELLSRKLDGALARNLRLREALGAYASALRSGEHESEQMRSLYESALSAVSDGEMGRSHRPEANSTHCRFCGAHPRYWSRPCSDGETRT